MAYLLNILEICTRNLISGEIVVDVGLEIINIANMLQNKYFGSCLQKVHILSVTKLSMIIDFTCFSEF